MIADKVYHRRAAAQWPRDASCSERRVHGILLADTRRSAQRGATPSISASASARETAREMRADRNCEINLCHGRNCVNAGTGRTEHHRDRRRPGCRSGALRQGREDPDRKHGAGLRAAHRCRCSFVKIRTRTSSCSREKSGNRRSISIRPTALAAIKRISMTKLRKENPGEILRHAVKYMLPKNRTQAVRLKRLSFV